MRDHYLDEFMGANTEIVSRKWGRLTLEVASFTDVSDGDLVVTIGNPRAVEEPLVRIHSICTFAEAFDSEMCDCRDQLDIALGRMKRAGAGILFYLRRDGRGIGLAAKVKATALEVAGIDTFDSRRMIGRSPDCRDYVRVGNYLRDRKILKIRMLTNNPYKVRDVGAAGVRAAAEPLLVGDPNPEVVKLYLTKRSRFGHIIPTLSDESQLSLGL